MIQTKQIKDFTSNDGTRPQLCNRLMVKAGKLYATDGHRALVMETKLSDGVYLADSYSKGESVMLQECSFPNIVAVIPKDLTLSVAIDVPGFVGNFKVSRRLTQKCKLFIDLDGSFCIKEPKDYIVCIDAHLIKELAGQRLTMRYKKDNKLSPVIITGKGTPELTVMPLRG